MRTKTILLTAAVVAAGALSSQAQNVFSQNVVGYVQQVYTANQYYLVCNPLDNGSNNTLSTLIPVAPNGSSIQIWNPALGGYDALSYLPTPPAGWKIAGTNYNPSLPPGKGFFLKYGLGFGPTVTNTFIGSVGVLTGATNNTALAAGFSLVSSVIPYADAVTNVNTINLKLGFSSSIQKWNASLNGGAGGFDAYSFLPPGNWRIGGTNNTPSLAVGEGFFVSPNIATNWQEVLPAQ